MTWNWKELSYKLKKLLAISYIAKSFKFDLQGKQSISDGKTVVLVIKNMGICKNHVLNIRPQQIWGACQ